MTVSSYITTDHATMYLSKKKELGYSTLIVQAYTCPCTIFIDFSNKFYNTCS